MVEDQDVAVEEPLHFFGQTYPHSSSIAELAVGRYKNYVVVPMEEVMAIYIIEMKSTDRDPINSGDMGSWFHYYKWHPGEDDEVFYPVGEDSMPSIEEGDKLAFYMDGKRLGQVRVLRVVQDDLNDRKEIWYNCKDIEVEEG